MLEEWVEIDLEESKVPEESDKSKESDNQVTSRYKNLLAVQNNKLPENFISIRNPVENSIQITEDHHIKMKLLKGRLWEKSPVSYLGVRITSLQYECKTELIFRPETEGDLAGLALFQNEDANLQLVYGVLNGERGVFLVLKENQKTESLVAFSEILENSNNLELKLSMVSKNQKIQCFYQLQDHKVIKIGPEIPLSCFSTEEAGGFIGNTIGMYGSCQEDHGNTQLNHKNAEFKNFYYQNL
jgi:alpha-N-arabinofuranosidase